jgi:hypothetical protein
LWASQGDDGYFYIRRNTQTCDLFCIKWYTAIADGIGINNPTASQLSASAGKVLLDLKRSYQRIPR